MLLPYGDGRFQRPARAQPHRYQRRRDRRGGVTDGKKNQTTSRKWKSESDRFHIDPFSIAESTAARSSCYWAALQSRGWRILVMICEYFRSVM